MHALLHRDGVVALARVLRWISLSQFSKMLSLDCLVNEVLHTCLFQLVEEMRRCRWGKPKDGDNDDDIDVHGAFAKQVVPSTTPTTLTTTTTTTATTTTTTTTKTARTATTATT